jgi:inhibitor of cysteine peptidase
VKQREGLKTDFYIIINMGRSTMCLLLLLAASSLILVGVAGMALFGPRTFTADNDGQNVTISAGNTFQVRLPENPTTGNAWNLSLSDGLTLLQEKYEPADTSGLKVGVGGTHTWDLKAAKTGPQTIRGVYQQPWNPASEEKANFSLNVNVVEGGPLSGLLQLSAPVLDKTVPAPIENARSDGLFKLLIRPGDSKSIMPVMSMPEFPITNTGTSAPPLPADRNQRTPQDIQLSYTDVPPAETINANVGDTVHLSLPENPSTGYSWQMTTSDGIEQVGDNYIPGNIGTAGRPIVGAGGTHEWTYKVTKPGTQTISGIYKRPWEGSSAGEKTYTLNVNVA